MMTAQRLATISVAGLIACDSEPPPTGPGPDPLPTANAAWTSRAPMPEPRSRVGAAAVNGIVYVVGGATQSQNRATRDILAYDPGTDQWRPAGTLIHPVSAPGVAALGDRIYAVGGFEDGESTTHLQIFDPATGRVELGPPLPTVRGAVAVTVLDGKLHAIGGLVMSLSADPLGWDAYWVNSHDVFDPASGTWSQRASPQTQGAPFAAVTLGQKVYLLPQSGAVYMEVYDPATDSWTRLDAPRGRLQAAAVALSAKIYLIGGGEYQTGCCEGPIPSPLVHRFDPQTETWDQVTPMLLARAGHAAAVVGEFVYAIGGSAAASFTAASARNDRYTAE